LVTKGIIKSINRAGNRCVVRLPLFETASSSTPIEIEALINITPGMFNNLYVKDVVFVAFEENALEKPIVIGKLFKGTTYENETPGGAGILDSLNVRTKASMPSETTIFRFSNEAVYKHFKTPKKIADYILWLESWARDLFIKLDEYFRCFKNWTQWQLRPENVEVDDGDLDNTAEYPVVDAFKYQDEDGECSACGACAKLRVKTCVKNGNKTYRKYNKIGTDTKYSE